MSLPLATKGIIGTVVATGSIVGIVHVASSSSQSENISQILYSENSVPELLSPQQSELEGIETSLEATHSDLKQLDSTSLTENQKKNIREEAKKALNRIDDYSFKLFSPCGIGTGWILDYQLPDDPKEYPTTWYIATNAHVIKNYRFSDSPYDQRLPIWQGETNRLKIMHGERDYSKTPLFTSQSCGYVDKYGFFDLGLSKASNGERLKAEYGLISNKKAKGINLFYLPLNFLKESSNTGEKIKNNYRDFAVLEIEFTNPDFAKDVTNDFANKYKVGSTDAINIFANPLDTKYSLDKLDDVKENFYSLAYPWQENNKYGYTTSFNEDTLEAPNLAKDRFGLTDQKINGYVDAKRMEDRFSKIRTTWAGEKINEVGHLYLVDKFSMIGGSSGGLYTDKDGNILGIKRLAESQGTKHNFLVPLRSNRIERDGVLFSPKYDLILGSDNQFSSYKSQVDRFIIRYKKRKTWLSERGWRHKISGYDEQSWILNDNSSLDF